ncbi:MAG: 4-hydroxy-tetrahydrodipicolinate reductase [Candidatus Thermoplasmatota archaeon]|nr:4-hydroxy-tetrahydrodipicolinate reductase [Candidatus Thermoplasmatota archaeon]
MIDICIAGALGKMGRTVIEEAEGENTEYEVVGAIEYEGHEEIGSSLDEIGVGSSSAEIRPPSEIPQACSEADVYISFTTPSAEVSNLPSVAKTGTCAVVGTTGYDEKEMSSIEEKISGQISAVFAPNFAPGVNLLYKLVRSCDTLPEDYDFSITEIHHNEKTDAPSGTASELAEIVSDFKGYTETVTGREGASERNDNEMEVLAARAGGVPGIHDLIIAGPDEMLKIEHCSFSKAVFARGALHAAEWVNRREETGIFTMDDVLESVGFEDD